MNDPTQLGRLMREARENSEYTWNVPMVTQPGSYLIDIDRIKSVEYYEDGKIKRVEYYPPKTETERVAEIEEALHGHEHAVRQPPD